MYLPSCQQEGIVTLINIAETTRDPVPLHQFVCTSPKRFHLYGKYRLLKVRRGPCQ